MAERVAGDAGEPSGRADLVTFLPRRSMSSQQLADVRGRYGGNVADWYYPLKELVY